MSVEQVHETIVVLDFGAQYSQLIARKIRELNVFSEIHPYNIPLNKLKSSKIKGIVLSGGPSSVYEKNAPKISKEIFDLGIPVLGICYGLQLLMHLFNGKVKSAEKKEFGHAHLKFQNSSPLLKDIPDNSIVWMSHGDKIEKLSSEFETIAETQNSSYAAIHHKEKPFYGIQFHPEVTHTDYGNTFLKNFCFT